MIHSVFDKIGASVLIALFIALFILETKFQLRKRVQPRIKRVIINFIVSIPAFALLRLLFIPVMVLLAVKNQSWQIGFNYLFSDPVAIKYIIAFLLLDYSNYLWHILLHKLPVLWRFHLIHHTDLDLDVSTAFRFHFGELLLSIGWRAVQVALIGIGPFAALAFEGAMEAATEFHHSNWRLPLRLERILNRVIVTPRMHGIHHSIVERETNSNWSTVFSWWDRLHRTMRPDVPQDAVVIGVPAYRDARELTILALL